MRRQPRATPIIEVNKRVLKERFVGDFYGLPEWKALYKQRQAVERVFSRLKGQRSLNHIRVRGWREVTAHCYLSLIAMQTGFKPNDAKIS